MRIGILLTTSPEHENTFTVCSITEALIAQNHSVDIFLMDDGGLNAVINFSKRKLFSNFGGLLEKNVRVSLCGMSAASRGIREDQLLPGTGYFSQTELSEIVKKSDRFLSFG